MKPFKLPWRVGPSSAKDALSITSGKCYQDYLASEPTHFNFFSSQLASEKGDALSSTAIQAQIRALILKEPQAKPISDQKIADHFKSLGITVARRTVAKYREQMHIPPSSQRKGLL